MLNDTDAAGIAEARYGAADHPGTVLVLTFGTGIGSAVLRGGKLEPNTELGQLHVDGEIADGYASLSALRSERLPWPEWIGRANRFLRVVEEHDHYDLIVIGGGLTHEAVHWEGQLVSPRTLGRPGSSTGPGSSVRRWPPSTASTRCSAGRSGAGADDGRHPAGATVLGSRTPRRGSAR